MSCASKKKNESSVNELHSETTLNEFENKAVIATNLNVLTNSKSEVNKGTTTSRTNYKPIDPTKPSSVITPEGKKYVLENAEVTEEHTQSNENSKTENTTASNISNYQYYWGKEAYYIKLEHVRSRNEKSVDRSVFNLWSWLWVLIIIIVVIIGHKLNNQFKWVSYVTSFFK